MTPTSLRPQLTLIDIGELREHEKINAEMLEALKKEITADGMQRLAVTVDRETKTVLNGHHRVEALKQLGCKKIFVVLVDYMSPEIVVETWRDDGSVTKEEVVEAALSGKKMPPKTTRHMVLLGGRLEHISALEKEVDAPLKSLR